MPYKKYILNKICCAACLCFALLTGMTDSFADIDPELLGIWETDAVNGKGFRHEFSRDGTWTRWVYVLDKRSRDPVKTQLLDVSQSKIKMVSQDTFQTIGHDKIAVNYRLQIKPGIIKLREQKLTYGRYGEFDSYSYRKLLFDEDRTGSYQLHRHHAFEALVQKSIKEADVNTVRKLLSSPEAEFLKQKTDSSVYETGNTVIGGRLWFSAIGYGNTAVAAILGEYLQDHYSPAYIDAAILYGGKPMVALLQKLLNIDATALTAAEISRLDKLLALERWVNEPYHFTNILNQTFCARADNPEYRQMKNNNLLYRRQEERHWKEVLDKDPTALARIFEKNVRDCLKNYTGNGRISSRVLNAKTIPGRSAFSVITTPLFFYATTRRSGVEKAVIYQYTLLKVLLDFGADPAIKPKEGSASLADYMFKHADHFRFTRLAEKPKNTYILPEGIYKHNLITAEIGLYNEIMRRISGKPYQPPD